MKRVAIVGAGPGGLAASMLLSAAGLEVTTFERLKSVGGRTRVVEDGGYRFDIGATFFLYPEIIRSIFKRCGLDFDRFVRLVRIDPQYKLSFEGGPDIHAWYDIERLRSEIAKIDPRDAQRVGRFLDRGRRKLKAFTPILQRPFTRWSDFLSADLLSALPVLSPFKSVDTDLNAVFRDPRTRLAFSFQTKYLGMSPFRCPSLFTILAFLEYEYGVWHPLGGCGRVSEAMAEAATSLGVEIRTSAPVEGIAFDGRTATGVHTSEGFEPFDAVVINADFADAVPRLIPSALRKRWSDKAISDLKLSCSTFMLYLGIEGDCPQLDHHTIFLARDYRRNIDEIEAGERPPAEPSIYVQNPGRTDGAFGSPDASSLYVLVPVGTCGTIDWAAERDGYADTVIDRLERLGVPRLRERIRYKKVVTPDDWRSDMAIHRGATFNLAHSLDQLLYFRPHNRMQDLNNVYLVGGGTHPGSGLPVIYDGARITSDLLLQDFGLADRIPAPAPLH